MDQAAKNNRAIQTPWYIGEPDTYFSKKDIRAYYKSLNRVGKDSVYGTVFKITRKQAKEFMTVVDRSKYRDAQTRFGTTNDTYMALKIIHKRKGLSWEDFSIIVQREANIQMMVHRKYPQLTPPVNVAGMFHDHGTGYIISPWVPNLKAVADTYKQNMYPAIESMFRKVWSLGILHMDSHLNNIFVTPQNTIVLLDWGAASFVPLPLVDDLRQRVQTQKSTPLFEVWKSFVKDHADQKVEERLYNQVKYRAGAPNLRKQNADWLVLQSLYKPIQKKKSVNKNNNKQKNSKQNIKQSNQVQTPKTPNATRSKTTVWTNSTTTTNSGTRTRKSRSGVRRLVAKGSGIKLRSFPYPNSAWSRFLFESPRTKRTTLEQNSGDQSIKKTINNKSSRKKKNTINNVPRTPKIKMVKSSRSR
jgi:hypothetical protein